MLFETVDGRTDDGRTTDTFIYYKLTYEPSAQVSKKSNIISVIVRLNTGSHFNIAILGDTRLN